MKNVSIKVLLVCIVLFLSKTMFVSAQQPNTSLKVMTYNIWNGFDWGKDEVRKAEWKNWIKTIDPDVLALQELCGYNEEKLKAEAAEWGHQHVAILKADGYPVGITSKEPIQVKERVFDGLWHGMLHCKSFEIDFFVVHLSPADCGIRLKEAAIITDKVKQAADSNYILLGDFNAHSPFDGDALKANASLLKKYRKPNKTKHSNLRLGQFDYSAMSLFLALPAVDECQRFIKVADRYTYPTSALIGGWQTADELKQNIERIDYILTSPALSKLCKQAVIYNGETTAGLSDHFPLLIELNFNK